MINILDKRLIKFLIVGVINTIIGMFLMFFLYNVVGCTYWGSSAINYFLTSILSFFLNKYFTFENKEKNIIQILRFCINIAICYLIAYGIAKPICSYVLSNYDTVIKDNISMIVGMCFFTILNYIGQRFYAFKSNV